MGRDGDRPIHVEENVAGALTKRLDCVDVTDGDIRVAVGQPRPVSHIVDISYIVT